LQRDLHVHDERTFLIPSGSQLPEGSFALRRVDDVELTTDEAHILQWEVSADEAKTFHEMAMADAMQRVGALMGVFTNLLQSANAGEALPRPESLDASLGLGEKHTKGMPQGLQDAVSGLAKLLDQVQQDPAGTDKLAADVAKTWDGPGADAITEAVRGLPGLLRDAGIDLDGAKTPEE
jgi:hypothetical protein